MLRENVVDELYIFLIAINYGLIFGAIYDFYRVFRYFSKPKKILSALEDLVFWILITVLVFTFLVKQTNGVIRGFVLLGFFLGYLFYIKLISRYSYKILKRIFQLIFTLISEIMKLALYPFRIIRRFLRGKTSKMGKLIKTIAKDSKKYFKITRGKK